MDATSRALTPALVRLLLVLSLTAVFSGVLTTTSAPAADAGVSASLAGKALTAAATRKGRPYRLGAAGPTKFDCSGFTQWSYGRVGKRLPRQANQQYQATVRISASQRRKGDLVFFLSGSRAYHVGVYAGGNRIWHAPKPGDKVKLATLWTTKVKYGRVR